MIRSMNGKTPRLRIYDLRNYRKILQIDRLPDDLKFEMEVVARVLPFRTNSHVVEHLIQWENIPEDPMFQLTFPQRDMLSPDHYDEVAALVKKGAGDAEMARTVNRIRWDLNPQPAGQLEHNVPREDDEKLDGMQHKYRETVLFFRPRDRPATPIVPSAFAGPSSWASMN